VLGVLLGLLSITWLLGLGRLAYRYRDLYHDDSAPIKASHRG
jgi:hypothetical protein